MTSIRRYLAFWLVAGIGATVLASSIVIWFVARDGFINEYDRANSGKAQALGTLLAEHEDGVELDFADEVMPEFHRRSKPEFFQVWLEDGSTLERSNSLLDLKAELPKTDAIVGEPRFFDLRLPDGRPGRAAGIVVPIDRSKVMETRPYTRGKWPTASIVVARGKNQLDRAVARLFWWLAATVIATCAAVVVVVAVTVRRGLAPLVHLGRDVSAIDARSLSSRLDVAGHAREVLPLSSKLNELLARLDEAFQRERRMTSNLAHELRTPIAEVRAAADVALKWPEDAALQKDAIAVAQQSAGRMGKVVDSLLRLARAQAGVAALDVQSVDVRAVVRESFASLGPSARAKQLDVSFDTGGALVARTDGDLLGLISRNLLENAVAHTPDGGRIVSTLGVDGDGATVWTLVNAPVDLEHDDLARLTEPLWTKDPARSRGQHSGLGLALAKTVASTLGASLEFALHGTEFSATFRLLRAS